MKLSEITLILGLDRAHLGELRWTWPTWMAYKPELRQMPMIVFFDPTEISPSDASFLQLHPDLRFVPWSMPNAVDQREKMLSGFVHVPCREVTTPWYLKLDTDAIATGPGEWIDPRWFAPSPTGRKPVIVSARWSYTKPHYAIAVLEEWGDGVEALRRYPRLNLAPEPARDRVRHKRIISWIFFGDTEWTRRTVTWLGDDGRLPHPSQDTFMFYCAKRSRRRIVRENMSRYQWRHTSLSRIRKLVAQYGLAPAK